MKLLITAAASAQAQQLKSLLNNNSTVLLGDYFELPDFMLKTGQMLKTPNPASPAFAHEMLTLCLDHSITKLYPLRQAELVPLAQAELLFKEFGILIVIPAREAINNTQHSTADLNHLMIIEDGQLITGDDTLLNILKNEGLANGIFLVSQTGNYRIFTAD